jgi:hypothetical protein
MIRILELFSLFVFALQCSAAAAWFVSPRFRALLVRFLLVTGGPSATPGRRRGVAPQSRACPGCGGMGGLLCDVEDEADLSCALWECDACGCFDSAGVLHGKRRRCLNCGHREVPTGEETCGAMIPIHVPCCARRGADGTGIVGICTYDEARSMDWNPKADP